MTARTVPTMPTWTAGQRVLASQLQQITTYTQFWASPPSFRMYQTAAQSIPNATYTQIAMDTLDFDSDSGRAAGTPWSFTIPVNMGGRWRFWGVAGFVANGTGIRYGVIYRNGAQVAPTQIPLPATAAASSEILVGDTLPVSPGDVMSLWCYQSSGGALNTDSGHSVFGGELVSLATP